MLFCCENWGLRQQSCNYCVMLPPEPSYTTRHTLIARALDHSNQDAWDQLFKIYENFIYFVLRKMGVAQNDVDDVA